MTMDSIREGEATRLRSIPGLAPELIAKLAGLGIVDSATLLEQGAEPEGRDALVAEAGLDPVRLLEALYWIDLERVDGLSWTNARLLTVAGVTTVPDLAFRVAEDLIPQLQRANLDLGLLKRMPSAKTVAGWIDHAKGLPQVIHFRGNAEVY